MATSQIQQSENVGQLQKVVDELDAVSKKNNEFKNKIVNQVDDIIRTLNGDVPDYSTTITHLESFLRRYKDLKPDLKPAEEPVDSIDVTSVEYQKNVLLHQNERLKELLSRQREYNRQVAIISDEYSTSIDKLIPLIQERKFQSEQAKFKELEQTRQRIEDKRAEEFEAYEKKLANEMVIFELNQIITEFVKSFDMNYHNEEVANELNCTLQYYQKLLTNKRDQLYLDKKTLRFAFNNGVPDRF